MANTKDSSKYRSKGSSEVLMPAPLKPGDLIAVVSPASAVNPDKVRNAKRVLEDMGWRVRVMPHALGRAGHFAASDDDRYADLAEVLTDPEVRAVLCSRGGYGVVHIMERLDDLDLRKDPKWIIGFSDISAIHAEFARQGVASIHASMAEHIAKGADDVDNARLFDILQGRRTPLAFDSDPLDRPGIAEGTLVGGNLAVLADLINTPYDVIKPDTILFIEDVSEPIYKIERILYQLRLSGVLPRLKGLIVGQFTDYKPDESYRSMQQMIADMVAPYDFPVAFNAPIGHVSHNVPLVESSKVTLKVTGDQGNHIIYWPE